MNKKYINCLVILFCLGSAISSADTAVTVANDQIIEVPKLPQIRAGIHYKKLSEKICSKPNVKQFISRSAGQVQVAMFFSYGCSVCRNLNKPFDEWAKMQNKNTISISKLPVSFNRGWDMLAKAFFTVQNLGKSDPLDEIIFAGINEQAMPLWIESKLEDLFAEHGIDRPLFKSTFLSFNVNNQVKWANDLSLAFELSSIPNIIVVGPYSAYITNLSMTQDPRLLFMVINHLVTKELKAGADS